MKYIRASRKIERAIDALIELQQDYNEECQKAEILYDVQVTLGKLNEMSTKIDMKS